MMYESRKDQTLYFLLKDKIKPIVEKQMRENLNKYDRVKKEEFPNSVFIEGVVTLERHAAAVLAPSVEITCEFSIQLDEDYCMDEKTVAVCLRETVLGEISKNFAEQIIKQFKETDAEANA